MSSSEKHTLEEKINQDCSPKRESKPHHSGTKGSLLHRVEFPGQPSVCHPQQDSMSLACTWPPLHSAYGNLF